MHCENCERKVKNNIKFEKGVKEFSTDLKTKTVSITYDAEKTAVRISFAITAVTLNKATTRAAIILLVFIINLVISY